MIKIHHPTILTARLNRNSSNSSKPSSTDGFKKVIHNCREKTGRKVGGQKIIKEQH